MRILWDLPLRSSCCTERAQDSCKRKGVDFALFNIPGIAKLLMPVDNEPKHGGVEPIAVWQDLSIKEERKRLDQLKALILIEEM
jgi:hypothetical protein